MPASNQQAIHDVAIITPDLPLFRLAKSLRTETPVNYTVCFAHVENVHKIVPRVVERGAKVLISRGVAAMNIRKLNLPAPVLDIQVSDHAMTAMLAEAGAVSERIAVFGYQGTIAAAKLLAPHMSLELGIFQVASVREVYEQVRKAKEMGFTALVGNAYAVTFGKRLGIYGVPLLTPPAVLLDVIADAGKVAAALASESEWLERQRLLFSSMSESIISVDAAGKVLDYSGLSDNPPSAIGRLVRSGDLSGLLEAHGVWESIHHGITWDSELTMESGESCRCKALPVLSGEKNRGAILIVNPLEVQGERGRRSLFQKGLIARHQLDDILFRSKKMAKLLETAKKYAVSDAPLFIQGESGTGKEMIAQGVHNASRRRYGPFVAVSCAAIPKDLLESELFGYQEGAFTGAKKGGKPGLLELADTGTLFLDEVAEISPSFQSKLLRILDEQAFMRLGGDRVIQTDTRIICATNRSLSQMVNSGAFRLDLYYRLTSLHMQLPPLRERQEDISLLAEHAIRVICKKLDRPVPTLRKDALPVLQHHRFPGNVRELFGVFERLLAVEDSAYIDGSIMREYLDTHVHLELDGNEAAMEEPSPVFTDDEVAPAHFFRADRDAVCRAMVHAKGKRTEAARLLGISTTTLWRRLRQLREEQGET